MAPSSSLIGSIHKKKFEMIISNILNSWKDVANKVKRSSNYKNFHNKKEIYPDEMDDEIEVLGNHATQLLGKASLIFFTILQTREWKKTCVEGCDFISLWDSKVYSISTKIEQTLKQHNIVTEKQIFDLFDYFSFLCIYGKNNTSIPTAEALKRCWLLSIRALDLLLNFRDSVFNCKDVSMIGYFHSHKGKT